MRLSTQRSKQAPVETARSRQKVTRRNIRADSLKHRQAGGERRSPIANAFGDDDGWAVVVDGWAGGMAANLYSCTAALQAQCRHCHLTIYSLNNEPLNALPTQ
jgi:hypothetical protein